MERKPVLWKEGDLYMVMSRKLHDWVDISAVNLILSRRAFSSARNI